MKLIFKVYPSVDPFGKKIIYKVIKEKPKKKTKKKK